MKQATEADKKLFELLGIVPNNTVILIANVQGRRVYEKLEGATLTERHIQHEMGVILNLISHDDDENK